MNFKPDAETEPGISKVIGTSTQIFVLGVTVATFANGPAQGGTVNSNAPISGVVIFLVTDNISIVIPTFTP